MAQKAPLRAGAIQSAESAILCAAIHVTYRTVRSSVGLVQGRGTLARPSGKPALALPGLIQGLEGEAENCARSFL